MCILLVLYIVRLESVTRLAMAGIVELIIHGIMVDVNFMVFFV